MSRRHVCTNPDGSWSLCSACRGRIHLSGCSTARNAAVDCCRRRHRKLFDAGHDRGLDDETVPMIGTHATQDSVEKRARFRRIEKALQ